MIHFLAQTTLNPRKGTFSVPHDSVSGVPPTAAMIVTAGFLIFVVYVILRVRKSIKDDEKFNR